MAKLSIGQKAQRMFTFIMGLRHVAVMAALAKHGFSEETLQNGLQLLANVVRLRLSTAAPKAEVTLANALDAFENQWFAIARHTLMNHYPLVATQLFANLKQAEGAEAALTVGLFVERVHAMEVGAYGPDSASARALLAERGLTPEKLAEAEALLAELSTSDKATAAVTAEEQLAAEQAMWSWYREWSGIARATIRERRLLRSLGFLKGSSPADDGDEGADGASEQPGATLPATTPGTPAAPQLPASTATPSAVTGKPEAA